MSDLRRLPELSATMTSMKSCSRPYCFRFARHVSSLLRHFWPCLLDLPWTKFVFYYIPLTKYHQVSKDRGVFPSYVRYLSREGGCNQCLDRKHALQNAHKKQASFLRRKNFFIDWCNKIFPVCALCMYLIPQKDRRQKYLDERDRCSP